MADQDPSEVRLRIIVEDPVPGVEVKLQRGRSELEDPSGVTEREITFDVPARVRPDDPRGHPVFLGPFTQGPPDKRFVYINSGSAAGQIGTPWRRRAKVPLGGITAAQVHEVLSTPGAVLEVRYPGTADDGGPTCATVRLPPDAWQVRDA